MKRSPTILLYNPISGHGHLDSWARMFAVALVRRGYDVAYLSPAPPGMAFGDMDDGRPEAVHVLEWAHNTFACTGSRCFPYRLQRIHNQIATLVNWSYSRHFSGRPALRYPFYLAHMALRLALQVLRRCVAALLRIVDTINARTTPPRERGFLLPQDMASRVIHALRKSSIRPDFVFNMYLDMYQTAPKAWHDVERMLPIPWGGIRFCPPPLAPAAPPFEGYYQLRGFRGICFLDERRCQEYQGQLPSNFFAFLPDVTDATLPDVPGVLAASIRRRAGNRKVVFLGGSLDSRKGLTHFFHLARIADPNRWFFVLAGRVYRDGLDDGTRAELDALTSTPPEHILLHQDYLPDERDFNAAIAASDFLYAVYLNFPHSSNMLGKAAHFRKPLLVSDRFLMGERTRHYDLGACVPEGDPEAALTALERLRVHPIPTAHFDHYLADFNPTALGDALINFFDTCLKSTHP